MAVGAEEDDTIRITHKILVASFPVLEGWLVMEV
jgi:hypothetical protein